MCCADESSFTAFPVAKITWPVIVGPIEYRRMAVKCTDRMNKTRAKNRGVHRRRNFMTEPYHIFAPGMQKGVYVCAIMLRGCKFEIFFGTTQKILLRNFFMSTNFTDFILGFFGVNALIKK